MKARAGVSLLELVIALGLFSIILVASLGFYRQQGRAFTEGNERMTLMQNLRFGTSALEQNLRTAGVGVPDRQPVVVYAGPSTFSFNANYASRSAADFHAVYRDPDLPASAASAVRAAGAFTIPGSSFTYPDTSYIAGAGNSPAETITFFFAADTLTERTDDHVLYRQVNAGAPEIIARHLLRTEDAEFFTYYVLYDDNSGSPVTEVPASYLPAAHTIPIHGAPGDTGIVAGVDSIRGVRVTYAATNGLTGEKERVREITRLIRLPNAGVAFQRTCGNKPILGVNLAAVGVSPSGSTAGHVLLSWNAATDELTGERDVLRYVIWRRPNGSTYWGDPLVSIPPGAATYTYEDYTTGPGSLYQYALAVQDCTPQFSSLSTTGSVQWTP